MIEGEKQFGDIVLTNLEEARTLEIHKPKETPVWSNTT